MGQGAAPQTGADQLLHTQGELAINALLLLQIRHATQALAVDLQASGQRFLQAGDDFQQAAFAAAIVANNGGQAAGGQVKVEGRGQRLANGAPL